MGEYFCNLSAQNTAPETETSSKVIQWTFLFLKLHVSTILDFNIEV